MRLVVTGCARSGTVWISNVLSLLGLKVAHERAMQGNGLVEEYAEKLDVEVSWLAAPFLDQLPEDVAVWHQVRDPRKVIRCCLHNRYFEKKGPPPGVGGFVRQKANLDESLDALSQAAGYWYRWNKMIGDKTTGWFRIEELNPWNLAVRLRLAGFDFSESQVANAVSRAIGSNSCRASHAPETEVSWQQIGATPFGPSLIGLAESYGYQVC